MPAARSQSRRAYIEPERHDELSNGSPGPADEQAEARQERKGGNGIPKGASKIPALGGKAHKGATRMSHRIQGLKVPERLQKQARHYRAKQTHELAVTVGGGHCGLMASALVKLASEDMALREAALESGNVELARKLGESARMHLLYAREIAAKDGEARPKDPSIKPTWLAALEAHREEPDDDSEEK